MLTFIGPIRKGRKSGSAGRVLVGHVLVVVGRPYLGRTVDGCLHNFRGSVEHEKGHGSEENVV